MQTYAPRVIRTFKYVPGEIAEIRNPDDISDYLRSSCLIWVDVEGMTEDEADRLLEEFEIDDLAQQDMRDGMRRAGSTSPRTKIEKYDHHAFIAGYSGQLCPVNLLIGHGGRDSEEGESTADWVITYRLPNKQGTTWSVEDLLLRFKRHEMKTLGTLVWSLLDALVDDCLDATAALELRIEAAEGVIFGGETPDSNATKELQQELFNIRRDLLALQHKVQPMSDVAERLMTGDIEWIGTSNRNDFENLRNHVLRASDQLTNQTELVKSEFDALLSLASQRMNEIMKTMTGWGSILLGAALIAGIYGMNFTHMPELSWYLGYPSAIFLMLILTGVLFYFLRKRDWL